LCRHNAVSDDDDDDDGGEDDDDDDDNGGKIHPLTGHEGPEGDSRGIGLLFL
jgi:hypothetical protein